MTRLAYFDCPAGAAGDMILGALVDAGVPFESLREGLAALPLQGYSLECRQVMKGAFRATKIDVRVGGRRHVDSDARHAGHHHQHHHDDGPHHQHSHRGLEDVLAIIEPSRLPAPVKAAAARIFRRLAEAEGRAHGLAAEQVHFHDVGAVDAIVDIAGACLGLHLLGVEAVHCSALPVGGGFVDGPHGRIAVPAPGTVELLKGVPVVDNGIARELLTPTGAAILTTLAAGFGTMPAMTPSAVGYGAGTMDLDIPNVVRVLVGDAGPGTAPATETIRQVETTIDDMSPQLYEPLIERLLEAGALDVYLTPVLMKKSRPGVVLTALCAPASVPELARILFEESTTIGVRWTAYERERLPRETATVSTRYGPIPFKLSRLEGRVVTATPEFEAVRRLARDTGVAVREVLDEARAEGRRLLG